MKVINEIRAKKKMKHEAKINDIEINFSIEL